MRNTLSNRHLLNSGSYPIDLEKDQQKQRSKCGRALLVSQKWSTVLSRVLRFFAKTGQTTLADDHSAALL